MHKANKVSHNHIDTDSCGLCPGHARCQYTLVGVGVGVAKSDVKAIKQESEMPEVTVEPPIASACY